VLLVGLATYLIVFNLNNIVNFCGRVYCSYKMKIIEQMKHDPNGEWKEKGRQFSIFRPKNDNKKPSEWMVGLFALRKLVGALRVDLRRMLQRKSGQQQAEVNAATTREDILDGPDLPFLQEGVQAINPGVAQSVDATELGTRTLLGKPLAKLRRAFRRGNALQGTGTDV
jgi:hypothetical protein